MKNWKRILAAVGTAALLASNVGAASQVVFADENLVEDITSEESEETSTEETEVVTEPEVEPQEEEASTETPEKTEPEAEKKEEGEEPEEKDEESVDKTEETTNEGSSEQTASEPGTTEATTEGADGSETTGTGEGSTEGTPAEETKEPVEEKETEVEYDYYNNVTAVDGLKVTARAEKGVISEGYDLKVDVIENSRELSDIEDALNESDAVDEFTDFLAYDIYFANADGDRTEPEEGKVQVSFEFDAGTLPAAIDPDSIAVQHFDESGDTTEIVPVADTTDGSVETQTAPAEDVAPAVTAEFEVGSFSTFTITWSRNDGYYSSYFDVTVHYVDENGDEIQGSQTSPIEIADGETIQFNQYASVINSNGVTYTYQEARYNSKSGSVVTEMEADEVTTTKYWYSRPYEVTTEYLYFNNGNDRVATLSNDGGYYSGVKTADVYLVYKSSKDPVQPETTKELEKSKTVTKNDDGTYNLNLSVSGAVGSAKEKTQLDIIFIVDQSGSMKYGMNDKKQASSPNRRADKAAEAIGTMTSAIAAKGDEIDARYSLVEFSSKSGFTNSAAVQINWTTNTDSIISEVKDVEGGATNYQAGIEKGIEQLNNNVRTNAQTVVIFLTDGEPTKHFENGRYGRSEEGGSDHSEEKDKSYAVDAIKNMSCNYFYAIGVGPDFGDSTSQTPASGNDSQNNLYNLSTNVKAANDSKWYSASSTEALKKIFTDIAGKVTQFLCSNVTVTDTLSDYVKRTSDYQLKVVVTGGDGKEVVTSGNPITLPATDNNKSATISASYDGSTKKITLDFPDDYTLEPNYKYTVSTTIEPTEAAYEAYRTNDCQYTDKPDAGTGSHSDKGEKGFYSNENATVKYTYNGETYTSSYDKPVIQVDPGKLTITKTFEGLNDEQIAGLADSLTFTVDLKWQNDGTELTDTKTVSLRQFSLESGTYSYTIDGLSPNTTYTVTESKEGRKVTDYECTTTATNASEVTIAKGESKTAAFTNKYELSVGSLKIIKELSGTTEYIASGTTYSVDITMDGAKGTYNYKTYNTKGDTEIAGKSGTITFADNKATITLEGGQYVVIDGLKVGNTYTVKEQNASGSGKGYKVLYNGNTSATEAKATIVRGTDAGAPATVKITNQLDVVKTGVELNNSGFVGAVAAVDLIVAAYLVYGFARKRMNRG